MSGRVSPNQELDQPGDQLEAEMAAFQPVRKPKCFSKDAVAKHEQLKKEAADRKIKRHSLWPCESLTLALENIS